MIAFQRTSGGNTNIYLIDPSNPEPSGQAIQVTHDDGADTAPAWAPAIPNGAPTLPYPPIAFERSVNGHRDIFVANYDGSDETNLTNSSGVDNANPDWMAGNTQDILSSPRLTFDSDQGGERELWVMDVAYDATNHRFIGTNMREVTAGQPVSSDPSWFTFTDPAPTPTPTLVATDRIAFAGPDQDGGNSQIDIAEYDRHTANSTGPFTVPQGISFFALTSDSSENVAPVWSPTGELIAYQKSRADGESDIYVLDPTATDESGDVNLTQNVGDNENPSWEGVDFLTVDVFPYRPLGKRGRKRFTRNDLFSHTLTAVLSGSGEGAVTGPDIDCPPTCAHVYPGATIVSLRATVKPGSAFAGWTGAGCSGTGGCTISMTTDLQVKATFDVGPPPPPEPRPVLSALAVSPRKFVATGRLVRGRCLAPTRDNRGQRACARAIALRVHYMLNIPARLTATLQRELTGRLVRERCLAVTRSDRTRRRCTRLIRVRGTAIWNGTAGRSVISFDGRIDGRRINPGSYLLTVAPGANGQAGKTQSTTFQILP